MTFFSIAGAVCCILICASICIAGLSLLLECVEKIRQNWRHEQYDVAARTIGLKLIGDSYWFSEDQKSMLAIKLSGEMLRDHGYWNASQHRDEWRRKIEKLTKTDIAKTISLR